MIFRHPGMSFNCLHVILHAEILFFWPSNEILKQLFYEFPFGINVEPSRVEISISILSIEAREADITRGKHRAIRSFLWSMESSYDHPLE